MYQKNEFDSFCIYHLLAFTFKFDLYRMNDLEHIHIYITNLQTS